METSILLPKVTLPNLISILIEIKVFVNRTCFSEYVLFLYEKINALGKSNFETFDRLEKSFLTLHKMIPPFEKVLVVLK